MSPIFNVPLETNNVATTPLPASILDSTTTPEASPFLTAFNSNNSACRFIADNKSSIFVFLRAETSTDTTSPPTSSVMTLCCNKSCFTFCGLEPGVSILLIARTIGALASSAC